jgi:hypothetical protein
VYMRVTVARKSSSPAINELLTIDDAPPPYEVYLLTRSPTGYDLCPNVRQVVLLTQRDFDRASGTAPGDGRYARVRWGFWQTNRP